MGGGAKAAKVDTNGITSTSPYKGTSSASFNSPFGEGYSAKTLIPGTKNQYDITAGIKNIDPRISDIFNTGLSAIQPNLQYLNKTPDQQYQDAYSSPLYQQLTSATDRANAIDRGRMLVDAQKGGLQNSTVLGSGLGQLASNRAFQDQNNLLQALNQGRSMAGENITSNQNAVNSMYNMLSPLMGNASNTYNGALGSIAGTNAQNSANMLGAAQTNANNQTQLQMQNQTPWWAQLGGSALSMVPMMF